MPNLRLKRKKLVYLFPTLIKTLTYDICNKITTKRVLKIYELVSNTHLLRITI